MSDDRFKQARRSLIDRHNQRQQDNFGDDFEDEATAMVDLDAVERQGGFPPPPGYQQQPQHQAPPQAQQQGGFPPPPGYQNQGHAPPPGYQDQGHGHAPPPGHRPPPNFNDSDQMDDATEMINVNDANIGQFGGQQPQHQPFPGHQPQHQPAPQHQPMGGGVQMGSPSASDSFDSGMGGGGQVVIGDDVGYEGSTQFINIAELAAGAEAHGHSVAADDEAVGYEGNTQFVDLNALQAGGPHASTAVETDPLLLQSYRFGPESIQQGEFTLIFAHNAMGAEVVLKRIWEGDATTMPFELRQRLAALDPIRHPRLVGLNGVLTTQSGAWVELPRPSGFRITDIVNRHGPQTPEVVAGWMQQVAEVLSVVHQFQFVYANLTTDAVWVHEDGSVQLEPFDILTFENRGNLGEYGAPELSQPPEQRIVSPSTDVYSMAAVMLAAVTGQSPSPQSLQQIDPAIAGPIQAALSPNPAERPITPAEFAQQISGGSAGGKKAGGKLPELNMKVIIGIVAIMGIVLVGALYFKKQSDAAAAAQRAEQAKIAAQEAPENGDKDPVAVGDADAGTPDGGSDSVAAPTPAEVETDARLSVTTSFSKNPPADGANADAALTPEEIGTLREEAKEAVKNIGRLTRKAQLERYEIALKKMAELQRGNGGTLAPEDQSFVSDLLDESSVRKMKKENLDQVNDALKNNKLTSAKLFYQQVESIDGNANARKFFGKNKSAKIQKLEREGAPPPEDAEDEE